MILSSIVTYTATATLLEYGFGLDEPIAVHWAGTVGQVALFGAGCYFFVLRKRQLAMPFTANPE